MHLLIQYSKLIKEDLGSSIAISHNEKQDRKEANKDICESSLTVAI